jgi:uncharacterized membrane protein
VRQLHESWPNVITEIALILGLVLLLSIGIEGAADGEDITSPIQSWLRTAVGYAVAGAEIAAALVISIAVLRALVAYLVQLVTPARRSFDVAVEDIRLRLGRALVLGVEFSLASDILRTAVAPTRRDILTLGAIVLLRTLLNYFLEREIRQGEERRRANNGMTQIEMEDSS